jgi:hypothetical protein
VTSIAVVVSSSRPQLLGRAGEPEERQASTPRCTGALADFQQPGQLLAAGLAADLQVPQQGHHPRGTHAAVLAQICDERCRQFW